jgi:hypothetical protein
MLSGTLVLASRRPSSASGRRDETPGGRPPDRFAPRPRTPPTQRDGHSAGEIQDVHRRLLGRQRLALLPIPLRRGTPDLLWPGVPRSPTWANLAVAWAKPARLSMRVNRSSRPAKSTIRAVYGQRKRVPLWNRMALERRRTDQRPSQRSSRFRTRAQPHEPRRQLVQGRRVRRCQRRPYRQPAVPTADRTATPRHTSPS